MKARPDAEDLARFREVSPIAHVDKVVAPTFLMLGAKDRRCVGALVSSCLGSSRLWVSP
jgi:dipeptidyl aminopeptidase/acylaminoacyl peptidase